MAVSSYARAFPSFECRSDPDFSGTEIPRSGSEFAGKLKSAASHSSFGLSSMILRFPPNFVRQLSIKARRNCSNIGVAQVVAASWSNNQPPAAVSAASAASAEEEVVAAAAANGNGCCNKNNDSDVQLEVLTDATATYSSFLSSDGSLAIHAGIILIVCVYVCVCVCVYNIENVDIVARVYIYLLDLFGYAVLYI